MTVSGEVALNPWDIAAGSIILREAGGKITDFSGRISDIYSKEILTSR
jgi:myo-inositol-1(or 4)-monophosphatase